MAALRASLLLCCFSMANDLFFEYKRKNYLKMNYTREEIKQMEFKQRVDSIKSKIHEVLKNKNVPLE